MAKKKADPNTLTRDEVYALPHWALVAFCARLARRLLPLVTHCWEKEVETKYLRLPGHIRGPRICVRQAELAAAKGRVVSEDKLEKGRDGASIAGGQAEYAAQLAKRRPGAPQYAAAHAANAALLAGTGAFLLARPDWRAGCEFGMVIWYVEEVGKAMGVSAELTAAVRGDYDRVRRLADEQGWTQDTTVSPKVFGPLWPEGRPKGWPED